MADFGGNFVNPQYVTPEQLATQRAYAAELQKRSGQTVNRPAGALANMVDALTAGLTRNNANDLQQQATQNNVARRSELYAQQLQGKVDPSLMGQIYADPMIGNDQRALIDKLTTPEPVKSEYGQPAYQSPQAGIQATPIRGPFNPAYRVEQGAEGVHSNAPYPAPMPSPRAAVPSSPQVWGDKEAVAAGLYPPAPPPAGGSGGPQAPVAGAPAATAPAAVVPNAPMTLDQLAAKGREFAAAKAFTQGGADALTGVQKSDIAAATDAPTIKRVAGVMLDDLHRSGDKMTFGPTAEWSNTIKRAAANYAPGLMKDQMEALASADSFDKMSAQLSGMLAKGGGTDAALFNSMKSVPGSHNSKEGAEALLKMTLQVADQQQALRQYTAGAKDAAQYEAMRNEFYQRNPIVNPITGNPIKLDLEKEKQNAGNGGFKILKVH